MAKEKGVKKSRYTQLIILLVVLILVVFFVSLNLGAIRIAPLNVMKTLIGLGSSQDQLVLFDFRLPEIILALLIGAGLAVSGAVLQSVTRNELADPGIIGINAGAGFAVVLFIFLFDKSMSSTNFLTIFAMPLFALLGALLAAFIIYTLAWKKGISPVRLILVGIGVNAGFGAGITIFQLKMAPQDFTKATVWLAGDIWANNWLYVLSLLPWIIILIPYVIYKAHSLNVLNLGDHLAIGLGTSVERERRLLLILAVSLAGFCVALGGGIAFLGLVTPHIARRLIGPKHELLLPVSTLLGALLLLLADTIGNNIFSPTEVPVGIVVAVLSAPYFIYLLMKTD
ncbi:iron(3+)-hydroxamate import system permease protein FhuG [Pullulanibacillus camelliae]|uniref:Iron(3+)-hydroxamate import system permease protein FhuG n=1 Tax=Pullulanibacillus camelliae TaxID=1707096 RepID=A0A8J2YLT2_9BACL|nr:iron ABC transporter permease [Pullulanibacillus camelliae]GGE53032.1 iron(3+)-hydroxamate import system permease protein FhuG [Pullulanibacillus camelliae]